MYNPEIVHSSHSGSSGLNLIEYNHEFITRLLLAETAAESVEQKVDSHPLRGVDLNVGRHGFA